MTAPAEPAPQAETKLRRLAETYLWFADEDEQVSLEEQIRALLGKTDDAPFDIRAWARDMTRLQMLAELANDQEERPLVVRAGPYVGLDVDQWWNARNELITAVQLHPNARVVLVEAGVEFLEPEQIVAELSKEITAALVRARFLGLDQLTAQLLCTEALTVCDTYDYEALREQVYATRTLGEGEGVFHLVRVSGVELLERYRVKLHFDDGVSRELDLAPLIEAPTYAAIRNPALFVQLRVADGTLKWPNGATLEADILRYYPALKPGAEPG